jgi:hypothetical protein
MIPFFQGAASGAPAVGTVFATTLYTGNGSSQTITNGLNLSGSGGLIWTKERGGTAFHKWYDSERSSFGLAIESNTTDADQSEPTGITAVSSTGYTLGADGNTNTNLSTYVSWSFLQAARFFDVVTYTGTGANRTVSHSLGTTPGMIIVKRRDNAGGWRTYHRSIANTEFLSLNTTSAASSATDYWNSTSPTSSVFSLGTDVDANASGGTYVAYLFAHDTASDGIVQCGSYTGNGSASGPTVTLGWNPQFVMIKRTDSTGDWVMFDTARGIVAGNDPTLCANSSAAENGVLSAADYVDLTGTGFQLASSNATLNATGGTYVYACVRSA